MVNPIVKDAFDWRHAIDRFFDTSPAAENTQGLLDATNTDISRLWAPLAVAWWVTEFLDLASITKEFSIVVLGCEEMDAALDGRLYQLLPWLIAKPSLKIKAELVGPKMKRHSRSKRLDQFAMESASTSRTTCGKWWSNRSDNKPPPDLFVIFHPGLEAESHNWMQSGELPVLLKTGIPVAVFSYDEDEAERDAAILAELGALITSDIQPCPLAVRGSIPNVPGGSVFSGAVFKVNGYKQSSVEQRIIQDIEQLSRAIRQVYEDRGLTERHSDAFRAYYIERDGKMSEVLRVFDRIYFDPACEEIFIAMAGKQVSNIPVMPATGLGGDIALATGPLGRACLAANLYFDIVNNG